MEFGKIDDGIWEDKRNRGREIKGCQKQITKQKAPEHIKEVKQGCRCGETSKILTTAKAAEEEYTRSNKDVNKQGESN